MIKMNKIELTYRQILNLVLSMWGKMKKKNWNDWPDAEERQAFLSTFSSTCEP